MKQRNALQYKCQKHNWLTTRKWKDDFLPMLAGLIPYLTETVLPALGFGSLSGLASTSVQKLIGSGLYFKKGDSVCQIETDGKLLSLGPTSGKGFETVGMVFTG